MENTIVTDRPTQELMDRAHKERFMVFTFIEKPYSIVNYESGIAFQEGWLLGLELKPDHRLALVIVPKEYLTDWTMEEYIKAYFYQLEQACKPFNYEALVGHRHISGLTLKIKE